MAKKSKAGLEEIAKAAGVSKMTVSRVLRNSTGFSEDTRQKVMREVDRLGYLPNRLAAAFGPGGSSTLVGICVPRMDSSLFAAVLESLNSTFARLGYQTMVGSHNQDPQEEANWLRVLASWKPAGVVLTGRSHTPETMKLLKTMTVPVLEFWELSTNPFDLSVGFSHYEDGLRMARCVVSRGRSRIGYVGALSSHDTMGKRRLQGFQAGLREAGLSLAASEILQDKPGFYAGFYGTETLLGREDELDLIYYHDDEMAIGGMAYLNRIGIKVPEDIGVAGWGGMEAASILPKRLSTTSVPTERLGKTAAEALVLRMRNDPVEDVQIIPTNLVPGSTI